MQIDRERALRELEISGEMLDELLGIFIEQTGAALQEIVGAINVNNHQEIGESAHFIKGSAGNLRMEGIRALAQEIESGVEKNQDISIIKANVEKLKAAFEEVKKEVGCG
ncbi:MAG: Hpt domain-containing protein [Candidatus Omnitrophica bacterium]|nr:Hpt domain-containing protein [Candidatus Omnitrophota bacterium]